jgi:ParB-like chromosome segregation protein Spo0J
VKRDPKSLRVSDLSAGSPDMDPAQQSELVESIRTIGQQVPILVSADEVLDGRKRLGACLELGIEVEVRDLADKQDPEQTARALNIVRTHYTSGQRGMFAARLSTRQRGGDPITKLSDSTPTAAQAASMAGVNVSTVIKAKAVRRVAAPEVTAAVEAGSLTLHSAQKIVEHVPKPEQPAAVARVLASGGKSRKTPAHALGHSAPRRQAEPPVADQMERALSMLHTAVDVIAARVEAAAKQKQFPEWLRRLEEARSKISRSINNARRIA